jgi:hypothetical protein
MERRDVFDTVAEPCDAIRPGCPEEVVEREQVTTLWLSRPV